jgi:hypothetical protein
MYPISAPLVTVYLDRAPMDTSALPQSDGVQARDGKHDTRIDIEKETIQKPFTHDGKCR